MKHSKNMKKTMMSKLMGSKMKKMMKNGKKSK